MGKRIGTLARYGYKVCSCSTCSAGGAMQPVANYSRHKGRKDLLHEYCRACVAMVNARYRASPKGKAAQAKAQARWLSKPSGLIAKRLRSRLCAAIDCNVKTGSAVSDLGCDIDVFKEYLERQFQPGMVWGRRGSFEMDHIMPLAKVDLTDRAEFLAAASWANYQPLTRPENAAKNDSTTPQVERFHRHLVEFFRRQLERGWIE